MRLFWVIGKEQQRVQQPLFPAQSSAACRCSRPRHSLGITGQAAMQDLALCPCPPCQGENPRSEFTVNSSFGFYFFPAGFGASSPLGRAVRAPVWGGLPFLPRLQGQCWAERRWRAGDERSPAREGEHWRRRREPFSQAGGNEPLCTGHEISHV